MSSTLYRLTVVVMVLNLLPVISGCESKPTGKSVLETTVEGRRVRATVEGAGFISGHDGVVEITCLGGKVVVETERVLLEGKELAKIPAEAKLVEVAYAGKTLTVTAEGKEVVTTSAGK